MSRSALTAALPNLVQSYVFGDDSAYYNSTDGYFIDQAGYSALPASRLEITEGTPNFVTVNSVDGLELDNTVQGFFNCPNLWGQGSLIVVMGAPGTYSTNGSLYPVIGGGVTSVTGNTGIRYLRVGAADYRARAFAPSGGTADETNSDDGIYATVHQFDQEDRLMRAMGEDGTVHSGSAVADNNRGTEGWHDVGTPSNGYTERQRFGNLSGVQGNTTATSNTMIICELHYFDDLLLDGDTSDIEAALAQLNTIYG